MHRIVDFHSHILPQVDDGSKSVEESLEMLRTEATQGVAGVVATPHFYPRHDTLDQFLIRRQRAVETLRAAMANQNLPELFVGAEVHYFSGISDSDAMSALTIHGSRYLLLEMPQGPWSEGVYRELEKLYQKQDLTPIIAHIERYLPRFHANGVLKRLGDLPVLVQANAEFFANRQTSTMALKMLRREQIHLLGSDCHDLKSRKPNLGDAVSLIKARLGERIVNRIQSVEQMVLSETDSIN